MDEKQKVIESFDGISFLPEKKWSHNSHYYKRMLDSAPKNSNILDIGCGNGGFLELATDMGHKINGLDFSPEMAKAAERRLSGKSPPAKIYCGDAYDIIPSFADNEFDCAFSAAAMHHMDYAKLIPILAPKLKKNGFFAVLDIYKASTPADFLVCAAASPISIAISKIRNGRTRPSQEERKLWNEHAKFDTYSTLSDIKAQMDILGVDYKLKRLLYFRYLLYIYF